MARKYLLHDVASDSDALNVDNDIVGKKLSHHSPVLSDKRGVAHKYSLHDVASDSDALNVDNDIVGDKASYHERYLSDKRGVARKYLLSDVASDSDALNVDNNIADENQAIIDNASLMSIDWHVSTYCMTSQVIATH